MSANAALTVEANLSGFYEVYNAFLRQMKDREVGLVFQTAVSDDRVAAQYPNW